MGRIDQPKSALSICIPTRNGEEFIVKALESAFSQTYRPIEIIVSDDASTDGTVELVQLMSDQCPVPLHLVQHTPAGIGENWNNCVREARGEVRFEFLFQDDLLAPRCVERMMEPARLTKRVGLGYCRRTIISDPEDANHRQWAEKYGVLHQSWRSIPVSDHICPGSLYLRDRALMTSPANKIGEPTAVLLRATVFDREGYFENELVQELDYFYWYKIMRHFHIAFVDEELVSFRLHAEQATWRNRREDRFANKQVKRAFYLKNLGWYFRTLASGRGWPGRMQRHERSRLVQVNACGPASISFASEYLPRQDR